MIKHSLIEIQYCGPDAVLIDCLGEVTINSVPTPSLVCDVCHQCAQNLTTHDGKWLCLRCLVAAMEYGGTSEGAAKPRDPLPLRQQCENCHRLTEVRTCRNGRWLCGECYRAERDAERRETWNADAPTRHDLDSALTAIEGAGLQWSAKVIRNYIEASEAEIERLVKGD